ncbi:MAG: hypothetical protein AB7V43_13975 [Acidimicrobiia bacterium]
MANRSLLQRTLLPVLSGAVFIALLFLALWFVAVRSSDNSESSDINLGDDVFSLGKAKDRARSIEEDGSPFFFPDLLVDGTRDIYVNHLSDEVDEGWVAFAARVPGSERRCTLVFPRGGNPRTDVFTDPCTNQTWPADGTGLPSYPVTVTESGVLQVDLTPDGEPGKGPSTTTTGTTTTSASTTTTAAR